MKWISPDYYPEFHCIANRCRHSCCIGWEIDIDEDTLAFYREIDTPFGGRLQDAIAATEDGAHFRLVAHERCPMLNENGLCDLITELGEESLCQICADHPRFRNFFTHRTEIGLGLCCEAAAQLILKKETPMQLMVMEDDGENETPTPAEEALLTFRAQLISILQDRSFPLTDRLQMLLKAADAALPDRDWLSVFRSLERLDTAWDAALGSIKTLSPFPALPPPLLPFESAFEQFAVYLLYRHLPGALDDDALSQRVAFCVLSVWLIIALCNACTPCTFETLCDFSRMFSSEIEYSDENIQTLLGLL